MTFEIHLGDCEQVLATLPAASAHCCVTSPPYYGLRDYGVAGQLGREPTPADLVARLVRAFRQLRRVLRPDGTLWLVVGDSYARRGPDRLSAHPGPAASRFQAKDLIGFPWQLALALRDDRWQLRAEVIWCKPNARPESVADRPTRAHEQVFLLTRQGRYFYDAEAVREPRPPTAVESDGQDPLCPGGNGRSVWVIPTQPFSEAHFATFPEALVERCLRAGTSAAGCCGECGAFRVRVVRRQPPDEAWQRACGGTRGGGCNSRARKDYPGAGVQDASAVKGRILAGLGARVTVGWRPTCGCPARQVGPCTVIDPFAGAGTTGLVALRLQHRFVGIELNPRYAAMARRRLGDDMPLFSRRAALDQQGGPTPQE